MNVLYILVLSLPLMNGLVNNNTGACQCICQKPYLGIGYLGHQGNNHTYRPNSPFWLLYLSHKPWLYERLSKYHKYLPLISVSAKSLSAFVALIGTTIH